MKFGKLLALMLPLALVMVLAVACGGAEPQPAAPAGGITAEELQAAISGIQIPEGLSEADVSNIVSSAMAAQPGITAADLQTAVDAAEGITAAELQAAIAGIQIPEGLSEADVSNIVSSAMAAQPGITAADVSKIVADQLAAQPGITAADLQAAVDAAVVTAAMEAAASAPAPAATAPVMMAMEAPTGTLNVAFPELGPYQAHPGLSSFPAASLNFISAVEGLVGRDLEWNLFGKLAESWSVASDQLTWTFKLRESVQFHDGWGEFTAEDYVFSIKAAGAEDSINSAAGSHRTHFLNPDGHLKVLDDHTFEANTGVPKWSVMQSTLTPGPDGIFAVSKKQVEELEKSIGLEEANSVLVGTGPWKIADSQPGEYWHFEAVMDHYRKTPYFAEMRFLNIPEESTRVANFQTRRLDVFTAIPDTIPLLANTPGTEFMAQKDAVDQHLLFYGNNYVSFNPEWCPGRPDSPWPDRPEYENCPAEGWDPDAAWVSASPDFDSPEWEQARKVRQAMMVAIDRQKIIDELLHGEGVPQSMLAWSNRPNKPEWKWEYDLERAKQLLVEAGYPDGFSLELYPAERGAPSEVEACEAIAVMWEDLGLDVSIIKLPFATLVEPWLDHSFKGISCNAAPPFQDVTFLWHALHMPWSSVTIGFNHPITSVLIEDAFNTFDDEERWEKTVALADWFWANSLETYGLWTVNQIHALGPKVGDWGDKLETGNGRRISALEWAPHREQ